MPFFSKKQKALMRQRRKRKREADEKSSVSATIGMSVSDETDHVGSVLDGGNKRQKKETTLEQDDMKRLGTPDGEANTNKSAAVIEYKIKHSGKILVTVPSSMSAKESKKFRKDARRFLRLQDKIADSEEDMIEFISSDEINAKMAKPKKKFPSIKELVEEKKKLETEKAQEEKVAKEREKLQSTIPESIRSRYIAVDCEMVGIGTDGKISALARVSLVDWNLNTVLDTFVKVPSRVTDYRTWVSGVTAKHIKSKNAMDVDQCRALVSSLIKGKILVGHSLINDLKALIMTHPKDDIRDTAKYRPFQKYFNGRWRPRKLRDLVKENIKGRENFQSESHDSVDDAKATMELFQVVYTQWEKDIEMKKKKKSKKK